MIKKFQEEYLPNQRLPADVHIIIRDKIDEIIEAERQDNEAIRALHKNQKALLTRIKALEDAVVLMAGGKNG